MAGLPIVWAHSLDSQLLPTEVLGVNPVVHLVQLLQYPHAGQGSCANYFSLTISPSRSALSCCN